MKADKVKNVGARDSDRSGAAVINGASNGGGGSNGSGVRGGRGGSGNGGGNGFVDVDVDVDYDTHVLFCHVNSAVTGGSNNASKKGIEQEKRLRREIANSNERRRMQSINAGFQLLKALLPRKDSEKMSKASILQQTAEFIRILESEKMDLLRQINRFKREVDINGFRGIDCMETNLFQQQQPPFDVASSPDHVIKSSRVPPKKRPKMENCDSTDDVPVHSDNETVAQVVSTQKCAVTVQTEPTFDALSNGGDDINKTVVDTQVLHKELMDVRGALDQERRLRLMLEEQLHSLSRLQTFRQMSTAAMMDYQQHHNNAQTPVLPVASTYESVPLLVSSFSSTAAMPSPRSTSLRPSESAVTVNSAGSPPAPPPPSVSPTQGVDSASSNRCVSSSVYPVSSSKQSLEAIVEAIRHLEGDQMFIESERTPDSFRQRPDNIGLSSALSLTAERRAMMCAGPLKETAGDGCVSQSRPAIIVSPLL